MVFCQQGLFSHKQYQKKSKPVQTHVCTIALVHVCGTQIKFPLFSILLPQVTILFLTKTPTCGNEIVSCYNEIVSSYGEIVCCGNEIASCGNKIATYGGKIIFCGNQVATYGDKIIVCGNQIVTCGNKIDKTRGKQSTSLPGLCTYQTNLPLFLTYWPSGDFVYLV